jgi:hypothetical protein
MPLWSSSDADIPGASDFPAPDARSSLRPAAGGFICSKVKPPPMPTSNDHLLGSRANEAAPAAVGGLVEPIASSTSNGRPDVPEGGGPDRDGDCGAGEERRSEPAASDAGVGAGRVDHDLGAFELNVLLARLDTLPAAERLLIGLASVVGEEFSREAVAAIAPVDVATQCASLVQALVRTELIAPARLARAREDFFSFRYFVIGGATNGGPPTPIRTERGSLDLLAWPHDASFRFRHLLIRDAAYNLLPRSQRAVLHEKLASWLEQSSANRLAEAEEIVGYHLQQAYRHRALLGLSAIPLGPLAERAAAHLSAAGRRALSRSDFRTATKLLEDARDVLPVGSDDHRRISRDLARALADASAVGRSPEVDGDN